MPPEPQAARRHPRLDLQLQGCWTRDRTPVTLLGTLFFRVFDDRDRARRTLQGLTSPDDNEYYTAVRATIGQCGHDDATKRLEKKLQALTVHHWGNECTRFKVNEVRLGAEGAPPRLLTRCQVTDRLGARIEWRSDGKLHRDAPRGRINLFDVEEVLDDFPAVIYPDGTAVYWQHGNVHRDHDLPAIVSPTSLQWFQFGKRHRGGDRPAALYHNGDRGWYRDGQLHRDGGRPAVMNADGSVEHWAHGRPVVPPKPGDLPAA